jgi:hypothetical protein
LWIAGNSWVVLESYFLVVVEWCPVDSLQWGVVFAFFETGEGPRTSKRAGFPSTSWGVSTSAQDPKGEGGMVKEKKY